MTIAVVKTKAEQQLAENFEAVVGQLPGGGWMPETRRAAFATFSTLGLPHRRIEEWKYTDLRAHMLEAAAPLVDRKVAFNFNELAGALGSELADLDCHRLVFVDGVFVGAGEHSKLPAEDGMHAGALADAVGLEDYSWLKSHLGGEGNGAGDAILSLNASFVSDGALVRIEDGVRLSKPIHIVFVSTSREPGQVAVRNLIKIGDGAKADIVESYVTVGAGGSTIAVTQMDVGLGADVSHTKDLREGHGATHLCKWQTSVGSGARYRAFQLTSGTGLARNELSLSLSGENSEIDLSGAVLASGKEHVDTTLWVDHQVPGCESRELFKYVLDEKARGVFQGKVVVRQAAQKTDGKQMAQSMMLSEDCEFDSKPELEIYADDVACGHGSTSAEIDKDLMFYLKARGIPEKEARTLLIQSFVGEALEKIEHEGIRCALMGHAQAWLEKRS